MKKNKKQAAIGFIFITMLIDITGWGIIIPVIPKLIAELIHGDISEAAKYGGWLTFAYAITQFVCAPLIGNLSDKYGRRPIILISLFAFALDYDIFSRNNEFAPWRYNNIVGVALRLDKLAWAEQFVEEYKHLLPPDTRQNTYSFNLARVYRFQKNYPKALALLHGVEYEDIGYNLISKMMLTITYFELDEFDALDAFIESFKIFLKRNEKKISAQRRTSYLNLLHYVRALTRLIPGDKAAREKLRQSIENDKSMIVNHEWLLEKLDESG